MNDEPAQPPFPPQMEEQAAAWILRRDRGLTAVEQDQLSDWLVADPRHGPCLARHHRNWERLNQLGQWRPEHATRPNADLLAPSIPPITRARTTVVAFGLAAAAALVVTLGTWWSRQADPAPVAFEAPRSALALIEQRTLEDGSVIEMNRGTVVTVQFTARERRVQLLHGEAHFTVAKNPARPFIVSVGGAEVRAVGTAFNVRLDPTAVEVLVTEGRVHIEPPPTPAGPISLLPDLPIVEAGECAVVPLQAAASPPPQISPLSAAEVERKLAWQPRLLDFTSAPLAAVVAEFNRRNTLQLVLGDADLGGTLVSASFRSDNLEGFVRLLEAGFGVRSERAGDTITLRRVAVRLR